MNNHFFPFLSLFLLCLVLSLSDCLPIYLFFFLLKYAVYVTRGRLLSCLIGFPAYSTPPYDFVVYMSFFYLDVF